MTSERYNRAVRAVAPRDVVLTALEIRHPLVPAPVRVINDAVDREIGGETYIGLRFTPHLASDEEGAAPRAELVLDNAGRPLTQWVEQAKGGAGATVRVMRVVAGSDDIEWEVDMSVTGISVNQAQVRVRLGYEPMLSWRAVRLRHDPDTSPGLF